MNHTNTHQNSTDNLELNQLNLSVVIPVFNEQENIEKLVTDILQALSNKLACLEIIIVDDCSTDNTQSICKKLALSNTALTYLRHKKNSGQSAAVYTGVKNAKNTLIATLDGDGQNPPSEINKLLAAYMTERTNNLINHQTVLFAGHRQNRKDSWIKLVSSKIANKIRSGLLKDDCPDSGCGLKLFHNTAFLSLPHFNHMHRFLPALFKRHNYKVINVPINHQAREFGVSKYNTLGRLKVGIIDLFGVAWLARRPCHPEIEQTKLETKN